MKIEGGEAEINEGQGVNEGKRQRRTKKKKRRTGGEREKTLMNKNRTAE